MATFATKYLLETKRAWNIFSPIVHSHALHLKGMGGDWRTWKRIDTDYIKRSDFLVVLWIEGILYSVGVKAEVKLAVKLGKPIYFLCCDYGKAPAQGGFILHKSQTKIDLILSY